MSTLTPPTTSTEDGFAVELAGETSVLYRADMPGTVWIEQQGGEFYVMVPQADLVSVAAALVAAHVRLKRDEKIKRK